MPNVPTVPSPLYLLRPDLLCNPRLSVFTSSSLPTPVILDLFGPNVFCLTMDTPKAYYSLNAPISGLVTSVSAWVPDAGIKPRVRGNYVVINPIHRPGYYVVVWGFMHNNIFVAERSFVSAGSPLGLAQDIGVPYVLVYAYKQESWGSVSVPVEFVDHLDEDLR